MNRDCYASALFAAIPMTNDKYDKGQMTDMTDEKYWSLVIGHIADCGYCGLGGSWKGETFKVDVS